MQPPPLFFFSLAFRSDSLALTHQNSRFPLHKRESNGVRRAPMKIWCCPVLRFFPFLSLSFLLLHHVIPCAQPNAYPPSRNPKALPTKTFIIIFIIIFITEAFFLIFPTKWMERYLGAMSAEQFFLSLFLSLFDANVSREMPDFRITSAG